MTNPKYHSSYGAKLFVRTFVFSSSYRQYSCFRVWFYSYSSCFLLLCALHMSNNSLVDTPDGLLRIWGILSEIE